MTTYKRGEVVLIPFPFTDLSEFKQRPALVISSDWFNAYRKDVILAAITSKFPEKLSKDEYKLSLEDQKVAGLPKPSLVKLGKILTIDREMIIKRIGKISSEALGEIGVRVRDILS